MPRKSSRQLLPIALLLLVGLGYLLFQQFFKTPDGPTRAAQPGEYLFCVWNVENLFDDRDDKRGRDDEEYDSWFSQQAADRESKYKRLADVLVKMNGGRGPDILCAVEVESKRAAELLAEAMNASLPADAEKYTTVIMEEIAAGRHIGPAIISRLPASSQFKPRSLKPQRVLIANLVAGGHELVVFASHWTSRVTDKVGDRRAKYADLIYGRANEIYHRDPKTDLIVCGDFNDAPDDPSVGANLRAGGDANAVRDATDLRFFNLMAGKDPLQFGTHYYRKPLIYDHICVSPGLLDGEGWSCDAESLQVSTSGLIAPGSKQRRPWRFGNRTDTGARGFSDHFPVTVRLRAAGGEVPK